MKTVPLADLEPRFLVYTGPGRRRDVETIAEAQGLLFLCPVHFLANGGPVGTHAVEVTFADRGVPESEGSRGNGGHASRWTVSGTGFADLTLSPSIDISQGGGCTWHGFIENGVARI